MNLFFRGQAAAIETYILVRFSKASSLLKLIGIENQLSSLNGRKVDSGRG